MTRAATHTAIAALALLSAFSTSCAAAPEATKPVVTAPAPSVPAVAPAPAVPAQPAPGTTAPTPTVPTRPVPVDTPKTGIVVPPPQSAESVLVRRFKVQDRAYSKEEAKRYLTALNFQPRGKPESTAVNWIYRDERGATLTYEVGTSEWAYGYENVAALDPKEYLPDSLIRTRTDGLLKAFLKGKADQYAFVNYEKTMVEPRGPDPKDAKEAAQMKAPQAVPAYYVGRYLRKIDGRYVLGDRFQTRIGVGRANAVSFISFREPVLGDSSAKEKIPTREAVKAYLEKWGKDKRRLGTRHYPFHPDRLRIKALKPVNIIESYVLADEKYRTDASKGGWYLVPRVTVLAEVTLVPSTKRMQVAPPSGPVLLHFHFPCTPGVGLCWPDGTQGLEGTPPPPRKDTQPTKPTYPPGTN